MLAPIRPVLEERSIGMRTRALPGAFATAAWVPSARAGIGHALLALGVGRGDTVWLPAFHCASMVTPVVHVGAMPAFVPTREDLSIDLDALEHLHHPGVRALVAPHFFGFPQRIADLRAFCDARGIVLIEDCAHAMFGQADGRDVGTWGDAATASLPKFFPVLEGGLLRIGTPLGALRPAGPVAEIRHAVNAIESAMDWGRAPPFRWVGRIARARSRQARRVASPVAPGPSPEPATTGRVDPDYALDAAAMARAATRFSRLVVRVSDPGALIGARRANYRALLDRLRGIGSADPVFADLPDSVVPYMLPLRLRDPGTSFGTLKRLGVPLYRWDYRHPAHVPMRDQPGADDCERIVQIPVHQSLEPAEIDAIAAAIRSIH